MRLSYGRHPSQYGNLRLPSTAGPWPVVVVIHGGFWRTAYGADLGEPLAMDLADLGFAAWNIEYRRVGDDPEAGGGGWPCTCQDAADAVDALAGPVQQAAAGQLDLSRVVALGHSAGGHLAGWLGSRSTLPAGAPGADPTVPLTGFISQAGVLDLVGAARQNLGGGAAQALMGGTGEANGDDYRLASPIERVPLGVPSICVHGSNDQIVPLSQSETFVSAARAAGDESELVTIPDADHFALITVGTPAWDACRTAVQSLLAG